MRLGLLLAWLISGGIIGGGLLALLLTTSWVGPILIVLAGFWILPPIAESIIKDSKEKHSKMKLILTAFFCLFLGFVITGVAIDEKEALDKGFSSEAEYSEAKKLGLSTPEQLRTAKNKAVKMKKRENQRKREENPVISITRGHMVPQLKDSYVVRLKHRISEADLRSLAAQIRKPGFELTFIEYLLPGMKENAGAWATTHYNPTLDVRIFGLVKGQSEKIKKSALKRKIPGQSIGLWYADFLKMSGPIWIYKDKGKVWLLWLFQGKAGEPEEMVVRKTKNGTIYQAKDDEKGEYYLLTKAGALEARDGAGVFVTAQPFVSGN